MAHGTDLVLSGAGAVGESVVPVAITGGRDRESTLCVEIPKVLAAHVAKLKPTELYDLEDESLKESYADAPRPQNNVSENNKGRPNNDRRSRNRRFKDRQNRPNNKPEKKASWWNRLWS